VKINNAAISSKLDQVSHCQP